MICFALRASLQPSASIWVLTLSPDSQSRTLQMTYKKLLSSQRLPQLDLASWAAFCATLPSISLHTTPSSICRISCIKISAVDVPWLLLEPMTWTKWMDQSLMRLFLLLKSCSKPLSRANQWMLMHSSMYSAMISRWRNSFQSSRTSTSIPSSMIRIDKSSHSHLSLIQRLQRSLLTLRMSSSRSQVLTSKRQRSASQSSQLSSALTVVVNGNIKLSKSRLRMKVTHQRAKSLPQWTTWTSMWRWNTSIEFLD